LKQRIITGLSGAALFLALLAWGGYPYGIFITLLAIIGLYEYNRMNGMNPIGISASVGMIALVALLMPWEEWTSWNPSWETIVWITLFLLFAITVISKNKMQLDSIALLFVGILYIGNGFHYMLLTRLLDHGLYWTLLLCVCIALTDSGAYFTGRVMGRTKLWPSISPNKTVEGAIGGIVFAIAAAIGFSLYAPELLSIAQAVKIGIVVAIVGQMGDLIQSAYKRIRNIKDTGSLLPGHGGVLDRFDSWLIVFPFVHLLTLLPI
jgi:phosphatidate cytidylyltransferase